MGDLWQIGKSDEQPVHTVQLADYYMSVTEVTVGQYKEYCLLTDKKMPLQQEGSRDNHPVVFVTWYEAQKFC